MSVELDYIMKRDDIGEIVLGIAIYALDNQYICGLNTLLDKYHVEYKKGHNKLRLTYKKMNILGGSYSFDIAIYEKNAQVPIDYKSRVCKFVMHAPYIGEGTCIIEHSWNGEV